MVQSKEWDWNNAEKEKWMVPSEDSIYLAEKWAGEGARSILDLGCGLGRHAVFFAKNGYKVTAVDLSKEAIEITQKKMRENQVDFLCKAADMMELPFANDAFDRVFSYHVISHQDTEGVRKVINEIARVLKPGGKVFLTLCSREQLKMLLHDYSFEKVRHIKDCDMGEGESRERCHYYIEATVNKEPTELDYSKIIGSTVEGIVDRPLGTVHPRHKNIYYSINYGYVKGVLAGDGAEQDVYILGEDKPLSTFTGRVIAVYHRYNDNEDKWIVGIRRQRFF